ncbi:hypothetical protein J6590_003936 [Homalodisca vitripennis]|nr:hypothetical protein J6590_003936 [Homalodisca vitripennis]
MIHSLAALRGDYGRTTGPTGVRAVIYGGKAAHINYIRYNIPLFYPQLRYTVCALRVLYNSCVMWGSLPARAQCRLRYLDRGSLD